MRIMLVVVLGMSMGLAAMQSNRSTAHDTRIFNLGLGLGLIGKSSDSPSSPKDSYLSRRSTERLDELDARRRKRSGSGEIISSPPPAAPPFPDDTAAPPFPSDDGHAAPPFPK